MLDARIKKRCRRGGGCLDIPLPGKFKPIVTLPKKKKAFDIPDKRNYVWKNIAFESLS